MTVSFPFFRRNLDYFLSCLQSAVNAVDPETGGGELIIRIPKEVLACANGQNALFFNLRIHEFDHGFLFLSFVFC